MGASPIASLSDADLQRNIASLSDQFFQARSQGDQDRIVRTINGFIAEKSRRGIPLTKEEIEFTQLAVEIVEKKKEGGLGCGTWILILLIIKVVVFAVARALA